MSERKLVQNSEAAFERYSAILPKSYINFFYVFTIKDQVLYFQGTPSNGCSKN